MAKKPIGGILKKRTIVAVVSIKLILLPVFGLGYIWFLRTTGMIPLDPIWVVVLIVEAAVPPATNLVVMSSLLKKNEEEMATLLFWNYIISIFTIAAFVITAFMLFT